MSTLFTGGGSTDFFWTDTTPSSDVTAPADGSAVVVSLYTLASGVLLDLTANTNIVLWIA